MENAPTPEMWGITTEAEYHYMMHVGIQSVMFFISYLRYQLEVCGISLIGNVSSLYEFVYSIGRIFMFQCIFTCIYSSIVLGIYVILHNLSYNKDFIAFCCVFVSVISYSWVIIISSNGYNKTIWYIPVTILLMPLMFFVMVPMLNTMIYIMRCVRYVCKK